MTSNKALIETYDAGCKKTNTILRVFRLCKSAKTRHYSDHAPGTVKFLDLFQSFLPNSCRAILCISPST